MFHRDHAQPCGLEEDCPRRRQEFFSLIVVWTPFFLISTARDLFDLSLSVAEAGDLDILPSDIEFPPEEDILNILHKEGELSEKEVEAGNKLPENLAGILNVEQMLTAAGMSTCWPET